MGGMKMNSGKETRDKDLEELVRDLEEIFESIPAGLLDEEPRFQLTGEIIPVSLRGGKKDTNSSEKR